VNNEKDNYNMMTFREFLAMREGQLIPSRPPRKGLTRINPFPTTTAHRLRLHPTKVQPPKPFGPTVRKVAEIVPNKLIPKL
jgi:hypothetical protein